MPMPATPDPARESPADEGIRWIVDRLDDLANAVDGAARSADPIATLAPHRVALAELRGVAQIDAAPPLGAVLDVVGRLAAVSGAAPPSTALIQPTLELSARALGEGADALGAGRAPSADGATVLALAALVRAARPAVTPTPGAQPIDALVGQGTIPAPRPAALARFRAEAVGAAERLRAAIARVRSARDPITSDEATWEAARFAEHLEGLAAEYGLTAVTDCIGAARRGLPTLDLRALWVLDEAGVELAEPGTSAEGLLPRVLALRARLDGVQPPPAAGGSSAPTAVRSSAPPTITRPPRLAPAVASTARVAGAAATRAPTRPMAPAGATLADLLRDGIDAFTSPGGPGLADAFASARADALDDAPRSAAHPFVRTAPDTLPDATALAYRGPSARAAARALREALERGERAATPAAMDELNDLLRLAEE